jgi:hypothetical protein
MYVVPVVSPEKPSALPFIVCSIVTSANDGAARVNARTVAMRLRVIMISSSQSQRMESLTGFTASAASDRLDIGLRH